ncbi:MAG: 50S ribosomal protein L25 [Thermoanaerobaculia bacterium]|nr:50S ribosomal protein L25 [Thermoanaerobaculia bacterium]
MAELTLEVQRREETGKSAVKRLRREGIVPAVVYGGDRDTVTIKVNGRMITDLLTASEHGIRSVFLLKLSDTDKSRHAMIRDYQVDPMTRELKHVDFIRVNMDETVNIEIPIQTVGMAKGQKTGGVVDFVMREMEVECLPGLIPDEIEIDISELDVGDSLRIADLKLPEGVKSLEDEERVVVTVTLPRPEVEEEPEEEDVFGEGEEPELIRKGKAEDEEEEQEQEQEEG